MTATSAAQDTPPAPRVIWNGEVITAARDLADLRCSDATDSRDLTHWSALRDSCESMLAGETRDDAIWPLLAEYAEYDVGCARLIGRFTR